MRYDLMVLRDDQFSPAVRYDHFGRPTVDKKCGTKWIINIAEALHKMNYHLSRNVAWMLYSNLNLKRARAKSLRCKDYDDAISLIMKLSISVRNEDAKYMKGIYD